ncbi:hypothetical protein DS745_13500 [Anaerobacillus alkaliphilus]|uniref:Uncharacterized protein n=1 Tax=Anaerobacillus alkaliphilus TaxID=1548597 RepID=A0A4Q0VR92_9BACI|nr:hypothetical protein [Anaerobacillus alkaliphilus]RXI99889.1 hypothetical protein DS745_13500 [Anaerobacillus alkaliphilus]
MYGFVFGLFALALLFMYGMIHTFSLVKKMKFEIEHREMYIRYGRMLGFYGCVSFLIGIIFYVYGVG